MRLSELAAELGIDTAELSGFLGIGSAQAKLDKFHIAAARREFVDEDAVPARGTHRGGALYC